MEYVEYVAGVRTPSEQSNDGESAPSSPDADHTDDAGILGTLKAILVGGVTDLLTDYPRQTPASATRPRAATTADKHSQRTGSQEHVGDFHPNEACQRTGNGNLTDARHRSSAADGGSSGVWITPNRQSTPYTPIRRTGRLSGGGRGGGDVAPANSLVGSPTAGGGPSGLFGAVFSKFSSLGQRATDLLTQLDHDFETIFHGVEDDAAQGEEGSGSPSQAAPQVDIADSGARAAIPPTGPNPKDHRTASTAGTSAGSNGGGSSTSAGGKSPALQTAAVGTAAGSQSPVGGTLLKVLHMKAPTTAVSLGPGDKTKSWTPTSSATTRAVTPKTDGGVAEGFLFLPHAGASGGRGGSVRTSTSGGGAGRGTTTRVTSRAMSTRASDGGAAAWAKQSDDDWGWGTSQGDAVFAAAASDSTSTNVTGSGTSSKDRSQVQQAPVDTPTVSRARSVQAIATTPSPPALHSTRSGPACTSSGASTGLGTPSSTAATPQPSGANPRGTRRSAGGKLIIIKPAAARMEGAGGATGGAAASASQPSPRTPSQSSCATPLDGKNVAGPTSSPPGMAEAGVGSVTAKSTVTPEELLASATALPAALSTEHLATLPTLRCLSSPPQPQLDQQWHGTDQQQEQQKDQLEQQKEQQLDQQRHGKEQQQEQHSNQLEQQQEQQEEQLEQEQQQEQLEQQQEQLEQEQLEQEQQQEQLEQAQQQEHLEQEQLEPRQGQEPEQPEQHPQQEQQQLRCKDDNAVQIESWCWVSELEQRCEAAVTEAARLAAALEVARAELQASQRRCARLEQEKARLRELLPADIAIAWAAASASVTLHNTPRPKSPAAAASARAPPTERFLTAACGQSASGSSPYRAHLSSSYGHRYALRHMLANHRQLANRSHNRTHSPRDDAEDGDHQAAFGGMEVMGDEVMEATLVAQLTAALADKARLWQENDILTRQVAGQKELLAHMVALSSCCARCGYDPRDSSIGRYEDTVAEQVYYAYDTRHLRNEMGLDSAYGLDHTPCYWNKGYPSPPPLPREHYSVLGAAASVTTSAVAEGDVDLLMTEAAATTCTPIGRSDGCTSGSGSCDGGLVTYNNICFESDENRHAGFLWTPEVDVYRSSQGAVTNPILSQPADSNVDVSGADWHLSPPMLSPSQSGFSAMATPASALGFTYAIDDLAPISCVGKRNNDVDDVSPATMISQIAATLAAHANMDTSDLPENEAQSRSPAFATSSLPLVQTTSGDVEWKTLDQVGDVMMATRRLSGADERMAPGREGGNKVPVGPPCWDPMRLRAANAAL